MDGADIFVLMFYGTFAWLLYMMTFRTSDFLALVKADEERKRRQARMLGGAARLGMGIAKMFMK